MGPVIVIPARSGSARFPGKPLAILCGRSLIERTWRIACAVDGAARVIVATDDVAIQHHVAAFGGEAMLTPEARNGCERAAWVVQHLGLTPDVVVNLQGDAVLTPTAAVVAAIEGVLGTAVHAPAAAATVAVPLQGVQYADYLAHKAHGRASGTTVVCDRAMNAMYFSKSTLPLLRHQPAAGAPQALRHLGLYAFSAAALIDYAAMEPTPLELTEGLEQLRWLEHGRKMRVALMGALARPVWSIDYPEDIAIAAGILQKHGDAL